MASLRIQVHFIFLLCPLHIGLTLQQPPLLGARWQQEPQLLHLMIASKGRNGTFYSVSKTNKPLPGGLQNTPHHISLVTIASYSCAQTHQPQLVLVPSKLFFGQQRGNEPMSWGKVDRRLGVRRSRDKVKVKTLLWR